VLRDQRLPVRWQPRSPEPHLHGVLTPTGLPALGELQQRGSQSQRAGVRRTCLSPPCLQGDLAARPVAVYELLALRPPELGRVESDGDDRFEGTAQLVRASSRVAGTDTGAACGGRLISAQWCGSPQRPTTSEFPANAHDRASMYRKMLPCLRSCLVAEISAEGACHHR